MAFGSVCPKCGFSNQGGFQFCTNCGSALGLAGPPMAGPTPAFQAPGAMPPFAYGPPPWEMERRKQIDRTKTGILLLLIGTLLSWIPLVLLIGYLLLLIGAILVILGRRAFGSSHSRNVIVSLVLFLVGIVVAFFAAFLIWLGPVSAAIGGAGQTAMAESFLGALTAMQIVAIVFAALFGIVAVLFTYFLQDPRGRLLLWAGFGASVAVQVAILVTILPGLPAIAADAAAIVASSGNDPFAVSSAVSFATTEFAARTFTLGLLQVVSAALFAAADYLAWNRINRGEIPPPPAPVAPLYGPPLPGVTQPGTMPPGGGQTPPAYPP